MHRHFTNSTSKPPSQPFKIGFLLLAKCSDYSLSIFSMVKILHICSLHMFFCKWLHHILPLDSPFMSVGISTRITLPYFLKRSSRRSHVSGKWKWFKSKNPKLPVIWTTTNWRSGIKATNFSFLSKTDCGFECQWANFRQLRPSPSAMEFQMASFPPQAF